MDIREIDWRLSSIKRILQALSDGLKDVERNFNEAHEEYQRDDALDHTENLWGITFVMAQTYITGTVSDANQLRGAGDRLTKEQLIKAYSDRLGGSVATKIELCDAMANYFKHHDEWGNWSTTGRNQKTVSILQAAGIQATDEFPCCKAANLLWPNNDGSDLQPLLSLITSWREAIITAPKL